jgi:hypothetical protein
MDGSSEEKGDLGTEDPDLVDRPKISRILGGMEIPAIGLDSKASFQKLMRALDKRRARQRRWRLLIACFLGAATAIVGLLALLRLLPH